MSSDGEIPEERCGFVLEPGDVPGDGADEFEAGSDEWYVETEAVCCWREVWDSGDGDQCIWHADSEDKPADALLDARADGPERLDGAYVPAVELGDAIDFEECGLQATTFDGPGLEGTSFADACGRWAQFPDANLDNVRFTAANLETARFTGARLWFAEFHDVNLLEADFHDADLADVQFRDANLKEAQFSDADLRDARLVDADLLRARFHEADLRDTRFEEADLPHAQFTKADLVRARFTDVDLTNADLVDARLRGTQFTDADLTATDLTGADATDATVERTTLERATLRDADLGDADLIHTRLHDARLHDVHINDRTTFNGVVPEEADAEWFEGPVHAVRARLRWWLTVIRLDADDRSERYEHLANANTVYRSIQRLYRENSMPRRIDRYYVRARDTRRKQVIIDGNLPRWLYLATQRWVMGYGERPLRVVATSLAVIGLSTLLYPLFGLRVGKTGLGSQTIGYPFADVGLLTGLGKSAYFSVITFTTLGYGDVQPLGFGEALATLESLVGAFLLALLVYVLGRRATR